MGGRARGRAGKAGAAVGGPQPPGGESRRLLRSRGRRCRDARAGLGHPGGGGDPAALRSRAWGQRRAPVVGMRPGLCRPGGALAGLSELGLCGCRSAVGRQAVQPSRLHETLQTLKARSWGRGGHGAPSPHLCRWLPPGEGRREPWPGGRGAKPPSSLALPPGCSPPPRIPPAPGLRNPAAAGGRGLRTDLGGISGIPWSLIDAAGRKSGASSGLEGPGQNLTYS